jgi:hypothetical protein
MQNVLVLATGYPWHRDAAIYDKFASDLAGIEQIVRDYCRTIYVLVPAKIEIDVKAKTAVAIDDSNERWHFCWEEVPLLPPATPKPFELTEREQEHALNRATRLTAIKFIRTRAGYDLLTAVKVVQAFLKTKGIIWTIGAGHDERITPS